ncbi:MULTISPECIES: permease-like cell division protein FtsX [unclassified Exiguobacterium]|uniref:permease-like cell division protein FtsX n=1 Tax=unclassified Exiguobacterium TaxID=2644629 RepID=UPI00103DF586|nr:MULTISPECIES: permease-like cell division protein FtsX [unclassified Exiguobacterium]TCI48000.1 ABC transporter permease [Exiguobacterium sp. SH5S32]TCI54882.1 ABC transporter permease [Exiguobacterium sp. SH1S4]TCI62899.1 ABC transporter permease [Exiguobacterium sp. SH0S2]TCI74679.1 ABC transporter permease [Exiguobacterium sp. SH1S1]TCI80965.1 ABC transporter permease [Exiguobacterium sp. SH0S1]
MIFKSGLRHLREGFKGTLRNGWMSFAAISAVTITLLLVGVFALVMFNVNEISENVENDVEIQVFVTRTAEEANVEKLGENLEQIPGVASVTFSSKEDELENFRNQLGEDANAYGTVEKDNPLHDRYIVKAADPLNTETVADAVQSLENVDKVTYGQDYIDKMFAFFNGIRIGGLVLIVGLTLMAMFLISNTIKMTIFSRRREIEIMRLVGAKNSFIRWPFFIEGLLLGVLGALIPIAVIYFGYDVAYGALQPSLDQLNSDIFKLIDPSVLTTQVSLVLLALGAFIGIWGSTTSLGRFLKV